MSTQDEDDLFRWFGLRNEALSFHQKAASKNIRDEGLSLALVIQTNLPKCADRSAALRKLREVVQTALMGIESERGAYTDMEKGL